MNKLDSITINEAMINIANNKYCLPIIQRGYVWEPKKIELLFDSIMRGYPIGTFLFWKLNDTILNNIQFYEFIKYGSESIQSADTKNKINSNINNDLIGILDGQQRLTSLYIGLNSKYIIQKRGKGINDMDIDKYLYLDLTSIHEPESDELLNVTKKVYDFKFLSLEEATKDKKWFKVSDITNNNITTTDIKTAYPDKKGIIEKNYTRLKRVLTKNHTLSVITLENENLNEVLEIFERTNTFGKSLKKTDLIFSSIVSYWEEAYEKMNKLLKTINSKPNLTNKFDINFIVLSSLVMIGESPKIKISSLKGTTIEKIRDEWPSIEKSILKSVEVVSKINMFSSSIKSTNALIPIGYFYYKNQHSLMNYSDNLRRYLQLCAIKGVFGVHADTALTDIIKAINNKSLKSWSIKELYDLTIDGKNALVVTEKEIDDLLDYEKGDKSLFTLSILYEKDIHINEYDYEQDHMHPESPFKKDVEKNFPNATEKKRKDLIILNNKVPNLQLLTKEENEDKSDIPLEDYLKKVKKVPYLPTCSYKVNKFEEFYEKRRELLKNRLMKKFHIKKKDKKS